AVQANRAFILSWLIDLTNWSTRPASGIGTLAYWAMSSATSMSFSAHFPVPVPQRDSDQLAPLPWLSASTSFGTSAPSDLASVSTSKFAHMHAHSSRLFMVLAIWPLPIAPT